MINYYLLTKPGIIMGNLITLAAGFALASQGFLDYPLFLETFVGLGLIIASACVFNNYIDRNIDKKMDRTKNRPLAKNLISAKNAIVFGTLLGLAGVFLLLLFTNFLTVFVAGFGFFVYVIIYSMWKCKTIYGTAIGSIAGAVPPVVGYCAVSNQFDMGAFILFLMLIFWQMPHFFSIAIYRFQDYKAANIPVLPIKKGPFRTKLHMTLYIIGFICTGALLTFFHYTGYIYLLLITCLGLCWLFLCLKGFKNQNDGLWARHMFRLSLIVITTISCVIPFDLIQ